MTANQVTSIDAEETQGRYQEVLALDLASTTVTVCLASVVGKTGPPSFETMQLTQSLADHFRRIAVSALRSLAEDDSRVLHPYNDGSMLEPHEIEYVALAQYEHLQGQIAALASLADLGQFRHERHFIANLRFYVIVLQRAGQAPLYLFRWYSAKQELSRSRHFAAILHQDRYDVLREGLLLFDDQIDCFAYEDVLFILNKDKFQRMFRFFELIEQHAETTLLAVKMRVTIAGFDAFADACRRDPRKLAKLNRIAGKPYLQHITLADIKKVVARHPQLASVIGTENGKEVLRYDPADPWMLLRLLDDDYLESLMTGQNYEVNSKRPVDS